MPRSQIRSSCQVSVSCISTCEKRAKSVVSVSLAFLVRGNPLAGPQYLLKIFAAEQLGSQIPAAARCIDISNMSSRSRLSVCDTINGRHDAVG